MIDELVSIGEPPETGRQPMPLGLEALASLMGEMGQGALTEAEYAQLQAAQGKQEFAPGAWFENLADRVDETELNRLAGDIWRWQSWDEDSRDPWFKREQRGIRMLGITDPDKAEDWLEGCASVIHPGMAVAVVQFWARAISKIFPPEGPVKTQVLGDPDEAAEQQAERVQQFMNYQYTSLMPGAYQEKRRLLMRLPLSGSVFTKICYDPESETNAAVTVEPSDMIVPYAANDLRTSPRIIHRMWVGDHLMQQRMESGYYRKTTLTPATEATYPSTRREIEDAEGRKPVLYLEDRRHCVLECHAWLDIQGLNESGVMGAMLPWVVTIDRDSQRVLSIRRNWAESDPKRTRLDHFSHWQFLPGLGFYGLGLAHFMGGLAETQTGMLRAILDSAAYENMQGGFIASDLRVKLDSPLAPGEFRKVDATIEDLAKGMVIPPRHPVSPAMVQMLDYLDNWHQKFSNTTDSVVGDAKNTGPVGTTLALIQQALEVPTTIHAGLHDSFKDEQKILARLNAETLPHVYPYRVTGADSRIMAADFDDRIDVLPVSDPRISSNTENITQQQALLQLASQAPPGMYDQREIHRRMLQALRVTDIEKVLPDIEPKRMEPVEEGMAMMVGKPVKAFADQDHTTHLLTHDMWFQQLPPEFQQMLQPAFMAHKAEHLAWLWRGQMEQMLGAQLPPTSVMEREEPGEEGEELPPELQMQIEQAIRGRVQLMQEDQAQQMMDEALQQRAAELEAERAEAMKGQARHTTEQARLDDKARRQIERDNAIHQAEMQRAADENQAEAVRQQARGLRE